MGHQVLAGSGGAVVRSNASLYLWKCAANKQKQTSLSPVVRDLVGGSEARAVAAHGGFGRLSRNRVSCSTLSVAEGFLALGGVYIVLCRLVMYSFLLWNCTTYKSVSAIFSVFLLKIVGNMNKNENWRATTKMSGRKRFRCWRTITIAEISSNEIGNHIKATIQIRTNVV